MGHEFTYPRRIRDRNEIEREQIVRVVGTEAAIDARVINKNNEVRRPVYSLIKRPFLKQRKQSDLNALSSLVKTVS